VAREALGIVGFVVGAIIGGPAGASMGFALGSMVGAAIDGPEKIKGPGLGEAPIQTSRDGIPIPIGWGLCHLHGNVIQKNVPTTITVKDKQGKGGGTVTESERRLQTYAIGVARSAYGAIEGVTRIWEFDKLVYDINYVGITQAEHDKYAAKIRIYTGDESQMPDPDLEAETGVGLCPAYRGLAYVVWINYDITDFGSAIPQYRFEINGGKDLDVTSEPYPIGVIEGLIATPTFPAASFFEMPVDALDQTFAPLGGGFGEVPISYSYTEAIEQTFVPTGGLLGGTPISYSYIEAIETTFLPIGGSFEPGVTYSYIDAIDQTFVPEGGTLT